MDIVISAIRERLNDWIELLLKGDFDQIGQYLASDYRLINGIESHPLHVVERERQIAGGRGYVFDWIRIEDIQFRYLGDIVVSTLIWNQQANLNGADRSGQFMITDIWKQEGNEWVIVERHVGRPESAEGTRVS